MQMQLTGHNFTSQGVCHRQFTIQRQRQRRWNWSSLYRNRPPVTVLKNIYRFLVYNSYRLSGLLDRQTLRRPTDETAPGRYSPLQDDTDRAHRGAYPSTAAVPPRCLASLVVVAALAVTDTYDGYERCRL